MKIVLTKEQYEQLQEDRYIDITTSPDRGITLYVEFSSDMDLDYIESYDTSRPKHSRRDYTLNKDELELLIAKKPYDPSWHHNYPLCPNCQTYMIYRFENCPKCGQHLDWSGFIES